MARLSELKTKFNFVVLYLGERNIAIEAEILVLVVDIGKSILYNILF